MNAVVTRGLTKLYGKQIGCVDVSIDVAEGEIFGFLGPNGSGKSTLVKLLVGLLRPTSGVAYVHGKKSGPANSRRSVGYLPENYRFPRWLNAREVLRLHGRLSGLDRKQMDRRIEEVLAQVRLGGRMDQRVGGFSKGMQQRLGIAAAILSRPRLLLLDEPSSALDPVGRKEVRELIVRSKAHGTTVFLNSHLLGEVEMVCDSVAFVREGTVVATGPLSQFTAVGIELEVDVRPWSDRVRGCLAAYGDIRWEGDLAVVTLPGRAEIPAVARDVVDAGGNLHRLAVRRRSLEDIYLNIVGGGTV